MALGAVNVKGLGSFPVKTDQVGTDYYQVMKLAIGAEGTDGALLTLGQQAMANSLPVTFASDQSSLGINLASYGGTATSLGQKAMASSIPVAIANNQTQVNVAIGKIAGTWKPNDDQEITEVLIIEKCEKGYLCELCARATAEREVRDDGA